MDEKSVKVIPVEYTVNDYEIGDDSRFVDITIDVLHTGLNYNGSVFTKEVVDRCAESIKNTPVLGYIAVNNYGEEDFQGHEYKEIETEDGEKYVYAGSAYGVIPESCNYRWVTKTCSDGVEREYFQVDALLWSKFEDAVGIFVEDGGKPQSMELQIASIDGEELEDGTFQFSDFKFEGCCLLSSTDENIQPAMIDSVAVPNFSVENIAMEIKDKLAEYMMLKEDADKAQGSNIMEENKDFSLTMNEQINAIMEAISGQKFLDEYKCERDKYSFIDIQDDNIIVYDIQDNWKIYGLPYKFNGDVLEIDYACGSAKKTQYLDLEEGEEANEKFAEIINNSCAELKVEYEDTISAHAELTSQYETLKADYEKLEELCNSMKEKLEQYEAEELQRAEEAVDAEKDAEFDKFDKHLAEDEAYQNLKEHKADYTLEDIRKECAVMFTRKNIDKDFSIAKETKNGMRAGVLYEKDAHGTTSRYGIMETID